MSYRRQTVAPGDVPLISAGMPLQVRHGPKEQLVMALTPEFVAQVTNVPNTTATVFEEQHALNDQQIRNTPQPRIRFAPRRCGRCVRATG